MNTKMLTAHFHLLSVPAGGLFGQISVTARTVGGGESWTSDIVPSTANVTRNTIAQALGQRKTENIATASQDYVILDIVLVFEV
jgi:hypothetical protein